MNIEQLGFGLMERGWLPEWVIRSRIRSLCRERLREAHREDCEAESLAFMQFVERLRQEPVAVAADTANEQHYEVPAGFFERVLGKHLKYSCCYWRPETMTLDAAEAAMLQLTCERAEIADGMEILELGCGWGSLTLWMAERHPAAKIVAVSNSHRQRAFIMSRAEERGLKNIDTITADMNTFTTDRQFDRVVSVEMFEHMRNYETLLARISTWLTPGSKLFAHLFCHRKHGYCFDSEGDANWMGRHFFTGGTMPSDHLLLYFQRELTIDGHWRCAGTHYQRTAEAWAANMERHKRELLPLLATIYGEGRDMRWFMRWKTFFLACAELFGYNGGEEWFVGHYRFVRWPR